LKRERSGMVGYWHVKVSGWEGDSFDAWFLE